MPQIQAFLEKRSKIIKSALKTIEIEAEAILNLKNLISTDFEKVVELILNGKGRVVITGIGKSAIIAQKIVATLNSTGTPSIFMHAADAVHGDLGIIQKEDIVICISKSGNTPEIKVLATLLRKGGNVLVALAGNPDSFLCRSAHYFLNCSVETEACPNNLAPTTSTTAQLVLGDALAVCLVEMREFGAKDFAKYHPGGNLGKKLYLTLGELALGNDKPQIKPNDSVKKAIMEITKGRMGAVAVVGEKGILGIVTDGDIRRMLERGEDLNGLFVKDIMGVNPQVSDEEMLAVEGSEILKTKKISQIIVSSGGVYKGMVHLHDLIREGIL